MRFIVDIESTNLLQNSLDYLNTPYRLVPEFKVHCVVIRHVDSTAVKTLVGPEITKDNLKHALRKCTEIIGHNIVGFDLPVLQLYDVLEYRIGYPGEPSELFGKPVVITDTLLWSKLLNADRFGGHSLDAWGKRLGNHKGDFNDWSKFSQEMLDYCIQDTAVNQNIFLSLLEEQGDNDWNRAYSMEVKLADLTLKQELFGFDFNVEAAKNSLVELDGYMTKIALMVDPLLPNKRMPKTESNKFIPPKIKFKKDGSISSNLSKFLANTGSTLGSDNRTILYEGETFDLFKDEPIKCWTKADIEDIDTVKGYLLSLGWVPSEVKERDITKKTDKTIKNQKEILEAVERYIEQTLNSVFKQLRLDLLECSEAGLRRHLMTLVDKSKPGVNSWGKAQAQKPIWLPTTPKLTVGVEKEICPNLIELGSKAAFVKDVVEYYTYRHRRNSIAGGAVDEDGEPMTGFLSYVRPDGRIPTPADTLGANTGRYRHKIVCNIPRVTSLYGEQMRNLFGCGKGFYQLGFDFASLEARIMGHFVIPYKDGEALAAALIAEKPNDIHCYREDTEILTEDGWKTFGELKQTDKVAQYNKGCIDFVVPNEIVWQNYDGMLYTDPNTYQSVTPNHRVMYESYTARINGYQAERITTADKFKPSSDKRFLLGGVTSKEDYTELSDVEIQLLVAVQADGYLNKDNSAIRFSFTKDRKISRLKYLLDSEGTSYSERSYFRKGRNEITIRLLASPKTVKLRSYMTADKTPKSELFNLSARQLKILVEEVVHWDGTLTPKGDVVLDTTSKETVNFIQTACSLINRKCCLSSYYKKSSFGNCWIYRAYISKETTPNNFAANLNFTKEYYRGFIGCVSVESGLVLTRRNGIIVVSGNTLNAKKLGLDRSAAKSFNYAVIFGAQPKKLAKMLGVNEAEGKRLFNEYWEAVPALKELKEKIEKDWEASGKKYIKGLDGRLLGTRSKHSLINVLFQSGGAISAKWTTVRLAQLLEQNGILGNPFVHSRDDVKVYLITAVHDEVQMAVHPSLLDIRTFSSDDEAKAAIIQGCSAIGHGSKGSYIGYETTPVVCIRESIAQACKELNLNVELGFEWIPGLTWGQCH